MTEQAGLAFMNLLYGSGFGTDGNKDQEPENPPKERTPEMIRDITFITAIYKNPLIAPAPEKTYTIIKGQELVPLLVEKSPREQKEPGSRPAPSVLFLLKY